MGSKPKSYPIEVARRVLSMCIQIVACDGTWHYQFLKGKELGTITGQCDCLKKMKGGAER